MLPRRAGRFARGNKPAVLLCSRLGLFVSWLHGPRLIGQRWVSVQRANVARTWQACLCVKSIDRTMKRERKVVPLEVPLPISTLTEKRSIRYIEFLRGRFNPVHHGRWESSPPKSVHTATNGGRSRCLGSVAEATAAHPRPPACRPPICCSRGTASLSGVSAVGVAAVAQWFVTPPSLRGAFSLGARTS